MARKDTQSRLRREQTLGVDSRSGVVRPRPWGLLSKPPSLRLHQLHLWPGGRDLACSSPRLRNFAS
eukprot:4110366-Pleurochrysis_carterae.AAC.1